MKSGFGWHLFRVTGIEEGKTPTFEEAKAGVAAEMVREKAQDAVFDLSTKLDDLLAGNMALFEVAQRLGLKLQQVTEVDRNGKTRDGATATIPQPLLATAAALQAGETSRLSELGNDSYYVVRADTVVPPVLRPLAEIRDDVAAAWQAARRDAAAKERADAIAAEIKAGKSLADVAATQGLTVEPAGPFTREGTGAGLPPAAVSALFAGPVGTTAVAPRPDGYVVAQLDQVLPVDPAAVAERRPAVTTELRDATGVDLLTAFQTALRQQIPVQIDRKAIDTLF